MFSIKGLAVLGTVVFASAVVQAQMIQQEDGPPKVELAVDYSYMRANATPGQCGCFNLNGGSAEAAVHLFRGFSGVFDLTGEHASITKSIVDADLGDGPQVAAADALFFVGHGELDAVAYADLTLLGPIDGAELRHGARMAGL